MPNELTPKEPWFRLTSNELKILREPSFEEYDTDGPLIFSASSSGPFWIGDYLCYGESKFGEKYLQAQVLTGLHYDTLAHYKSIASRVIPQNRVKGVPYSHHREVAALSFDDQRIFLEEAKRFDWTVKDLKEKVQRHRGIADRYVCPICERKRDEIVATVRIEVCTSCVARLKENKEV